MKKEEKEKMNLKEFTTRINLLTYKQQLMIKPQIYYNPDHIHYYDQFNKGNYEFCIDYLNENIELLNASKITNESMTRQERRENMKEINEALKKLNEKPVKLTQEQQDYIITNSKVLFGFQIKSSSLYDQNDFIELPEDLSKKVTKDLIKIASQLNINVYMDWEDEDGDTFCLKEDEQILDAINIYCLLINGYNSNGWTNINEVKSLYNNAYELITSEEGYVKFKKEQLDKMFDKINKDIEYELKHQTWDEEMEFERQYDECCGANEEAEEWTAFQWTNDYIERCGNEELSNINSASTILSTMLLIDEECLGEYFERYKDIFTPTIIPDILLMRDEHHKFRESLRALSVDSIKPSMITDIPESVEEMLKNADN